MIAAPVSAFLVTDTPRTVEPHHRVVVWLGENHGPLPGIVTLHAKTQDDFLSAAMEHVQPGLVEPFECTLTGDRGRVSALAEFLLERYKYASRQAHFDLNTLSWTYKICALQSLQKVNHLGERLHTVDQLMGRHRDEACVIIGAGPSLDIGSIDPEKILTIATTRTAILCLKAGWCPDYIIHIDPAPFDGLRERLLAYPAISHANWLIPLQAHQNFLDLPGRVFWFGSRLNPVSNWIAKEVNPHMRLPLILSGGSVSCCAFTIAEVMGCSPICLIGHDLSYAGSGRYFDADAPDRFTSSGLTDPDRVYLPGISGRNVQTTLDYMTYAEWFVTQGRNSRRKLINCTTQGVHLPGFEHVPIDSVYTRYCGKAKSAVPALEPKRFVRPNVESALDRAREISAQLDHHIRANDPGRACDLLMSMTRIDSDGFILTACTQYESRIMAYFSHLPATHPKMRRCIETMAAASRAACAELADSLAGAIHVPTITEEVVDRRMRELREINALG